MQISGSGAKVNLSSHIPKSATKKFRHPDASGTPYLTKSQPTMTEEEYREAIAAQTRKDAASGRSGMECTGFKALYNDFVSVASPDRQKIIANGISDFNQWSQSNHAQTLQRAGSLLEVLFGDGSKYAYTHIEGNVNYAEFFDGGGSGQMVAAYHETTGWTFSSTESENRRSTEFWGIYLNTWNAEVQRINAECASATAQQGRPKAAGMDSAGRFAPMMDINI